MSEALLGLVAALAADGPEITSSIAAIAGGHGAVGVGVTLGSNVFNLAALLGLSALIAGPIRFHRRTIVLEGAVGVWIAVVSLAVVEGLVGPAIGLVMTLVVFLPYVGYSAVRPERRIRLRLPAGASRWLARALAEEELELSVAIRPRRGDGRDAAVALAAAAIVIGASIVMEETATSLGAQAALAPIIVGGLVLAGVTSLPNAVAAVYLASRGRGAATLSEAFNSNALNVIVGLLTPAALVGLADRSAGASFVVASWVLLTAATVALALHGRGLDRCAGSLIIAGYFVFAAVLATS
jgi:cation:H+ antiporter